MFTVEYPRKQVYEMTAQVHLMGRPNIMRSCKERSDRCICPVTYAKIILSMRHPNINALSSIGRGNTSAIFKREWFNKD